MVRQSWPSMHRDEATPAAFGNGEIPELWALEEVATVFAPRQFPFFPEDLRMYRSSSTGILQGLGCIPGNCGPALKKLAELR